MKTSNLTGAALDWAVAKCEAERLALPYGGKSFLDGVVVHPDYNKFYPSTNWAQGGAIIERLGISVSLRYGSTSSDSTKDVWDAVVKPEHYSTGKRHSGVLKETIQTGETPLIAAMRCYVASKLGDEVDLPTDLIPPDDHGSIKGQTP